MIVIRKGRFRLWEGGQGLVEYALILVLVAVAAIVILAVLGRQIQNVFCDALLSLGRNAPQVALCDAPRVTCGVSSGAVIHNPVSMEIFVTDDDGLEGNITVETYLDAETTPRIEYHYKYCFPTGDGPCGSMNLSHGSHTIRAIARDREGNTGECTTTFTVN